MSFILDALKKSEIERQRQSVPGLMDTRMAGRRNRLPLWAVALGALFCINLAVLSIVLWRKNTAATPAAVAAGGAALLSASPASSNSRQPNSAHFSPLDAAPEFAPEIPVVGANDAAPLKPLIRRPDAPRGGDSAAAAHRPDPLLSADNSPADDQEVLPSISEISLSGAQALPELHLDVHVYATNPAERFVYINMRKYHEGATVADGLRIERIRRDGVLLNFQGLRFILPRQP
jgi:general secretion pathway protein B